MPDLFLHLFPDVTRELVAVVSEVIEGLDRPPRANLPEDDEDLAFWWLGSLKELMDEDCSALLGLISSPRFGRGAIRIDEETAERVLRAASAIRLRLQEYHLGRVSEEDLELGNVDYGRLNQEDQLYFRAYHILAAIQEKIVEGMDPDYHTDS